VAAASSVRSFATHLPSLGIETHVLAPDDPKWIHRDDELQPPTTRLVHRARYLGRRAQNRRGAAHSTQLERVGVHARLPGGGCSCRTRT
jgi:hypothetical protein